MLRPFGYHLRSFLVIVLKDSSGLGNGEASGGGGLGVGRREKGVGLGRVEGGVGSGRKGRGELGVVR